MKSNNLIRFGDTSFRLRNQIQFYVNLIFFIDGYDSSGEYIEISDIDYKEFLSGVGLNYNWDKKIDIHKRIKLMFKQLEKFGLFLTKDKKIKLNKKFKDFTYCLLNRYRDFINCGFEIHKVLFSILMLFSKSDESIRFRELIIMLSRNKVYKFEKEKLAFFSLPLSYIKLDDVWCDSPWEVISTFNDHFTYEKLQKFTQLYKSNQKYKINEVLSSIKIPTFKKPSRKLEDLCEYIIRGNNSQEFIDSENVKNMLNKIYKEFNMKTKYDSFFDMFRHEEENLVKYAYISVKNSVILKDYLDINIRWFKDIGLLKESSKKNDVKVNKNYLNLLYKLLEKYEYFDEEFDLLKVVDLAYKIILDENLQIFETVKYPFTKHEVLEYLRYFWKGEYDLVFRKTSLEGIANATIYEYLVNLSFAIQYKLDPNDFKRSMCRTILNDKLLPVTHAPGRQADGYIYNSNFNSIEAFTIESTILRGEKILNEKVPIQRHANDFYIKIKDDLNENLNTPTAVLVHNDPISYDLINSFCNENSSTFFYGSKNIDDRIRIIMINTDMLVKLLEEEKLNKFIEHLRAVIPYSNKEFKTKDEGVEWYMNLVNEIN